VNIKLIGEKSLPPLMTVQVFIVKQVNFAKGFLLAVCLMLVSFFILTCEFRDFLDALVFANAW
jgi:hypothetical protein